MKRKAWVDCPLRFTHDPQYGSVAEQVQIKMLDWYMTQEEIKESKKGTQLRRRVESSTVIATTGKLPDSFAKYLDRFDSAEPEVDMHESLIVVEEAGVYAVNLASDAPFKLHDFGPRGLPEQDNQILTPIGQGLGR